MVGILVHPVSKRALVLVEHGEKLIARELTLETGHNIVQLKSVGCQVNPSRMGREGYHRLSGPKTIGGSPVGNIGSELFHVFVESAHV